MENIKYCPYCDKERLIINNKCPVCGHNPNENPPKTEPETKQEETTQQQTTTKPKKKKKYPFPRYKPAPITINRITNTIKIIKEQIKNNTFKREQITKPLKLTYTQARHYIEVLIYYNIIKKTKGLGMYVLLPEKEWDDEIKTLLRKNKIMGS